MKFRKAIFTAASPNTTFDDALLAKLTLFSPWKWKDPKYNNKFETELRYYLKVDFVKLVDSGRSALYSILKSIGVDQNSEVIGPSFTCVVVANAISWTGAKPIYLDTKQKDFNADYSLITNYITDKTRAIVVQHTFGKKVDVEAIKIKLKEIEREDIFIIEDFAHILKRNIELQGDFGFTTFGIEKVISSVRGGAIFTNSKNEFLEIEKFVDSLPELPVSRVIISLMNPVFWAVAIPLHSAGFGRFTIGAFIRGIWRKLGFLGIMVEEKENRGLKPNWFPAKMSPALSILGSKQLSKLDKFNIHRQKITAIYHKHLSQISDEEGGLDSNRIYLRYPILLPNQQIWNSVWDKSRELRVTLGNWFAKPLYGSTVSDDTYKTLCYVPAETPTTIQKAGLVLNLPTSVNISVERAEELASEIVNILSN